MLYLARCCLQQNSSSARKYVGQVSTKWLLKSQHSRSNAQMLGEVGSNALCCGNFSIRMNSCWDEFHEHLSFFFFDEFLAAKTCISGLISQRVDLLVGVWYVISMFPSNLKFTRYLVMRH